TLKIKRAVITDHVVLARDKKYFARLETLQVLLKPVEFFRLGKMAQIARVQDEIWWSRQCVDLRDRFLQRADDVLVGIFVKTDMAVAYWDKAEIAANRRSSRAEQFGREHTAAHRPEHSSACPGHAFKEPAAIDAIGIIVM